VLFGYAINTDPKHLPTAVVVADSGPLVRSIVRAVENTAYFRVVAQPTESEAERMLARGEVQFVIVIPAGFSSRLLRGEQPALAVYADATDPSASGAGLAALAQLPDFALTHDLRGPLATLSAVASAVRGAGAPALQPGRADQLQRGAGPDGRDPDDDAGDDDGDGDDARTRARHAGEPARHAGAAAGGDGRQDRAVPA
jgi:hypothetical protein